MCEFTSGHPAYEQLLAVIDREPAHISHAARRHARECGKCRQEIDDCRTALDDYAEYEEALILPAIAPPERPWLDIRMAMRELDASRNRQALKPAAGSWIRERLGTIAGRIAGGSAAIGCVAFAAIRNTRPRTWFPTASRLRWRRRRLASSIRGGLSTAHRVYPWTRGPQSWNRR